MLKGIRILELTDGMFGSSGVCHLADIGAEVLRIEAPQMTDRGQSLPTMRVMPEAGYDYFFEQYNRNKKSLAINPRTVEGRELIHKLGRKVHVFATTIAENTLKEIGLDYTTLKRINPAIIYAHGSCFGHCGPDKDKPIIDETAQARAGLMPIFPQPGYPPVYTGTGYPIAGLVLAHGIMLALYHQRRTGQGQMVEVSLLGSHLLFGTSILVGALAAGPVREIIEPTTRREGANPLLGFYQAKDDRWIVLSLTATDPWWSDFCKVFDLQHLEHDPRFDTHEKRVITNKDKLFDIITDTLKTRSWTEWSKRLKEFDIPIQPCDDYGELLKNPQAWVNDFLIEYEHPKHGKIKQLGLPVQFSAIKGIVRSPAPDIGQHNDYIPAFLKSTPDVVEELKKLKKQRLTKALEGITVIDLGMWLVGPMAGAYLADMGADVIKLETTTGGDPVRGTIKAAKVPVTDWNFLFGCYNRNKRSIAVDFKKEKGKEIAYQLVEKADVFISNLRQAALDRMGLSYKELSDINPQIVYVVGNGFGRFGSLANAATYDILAQARTGLQKMLGEPGHEPIWTGPGTGDSPAALLLAYAAVTGLLYRELTGKGQDICSSLFGVQLMYAARTLVPYLATNSDLVNKQHSRKEAVNPLFNLYATADRWIMLAMWDSERWWPFVCKALGLENLEHDLRFDTHYKRLQNNKALIRLLENALKSKSCSEWLEISKELGLLVEPVNTAKELLEDPQPYMSGYIQEIAVPRLGKRNTIGFPAHLSRTPATIRMPAPELGQHTEEVLLELGYTWEQLTALKEARVIL